MNTWPVCFYPLSYYTCALLLLTPSNSCLMPTAYPRQTAFHSVGSPSSALCTCHQRNTFPPGFHPSLTQPSKEGTATHPPVLQMETPGTDFSNLPRFKANNSANSLVSPESPHLDKISSRGQHSMLLQTTM